MIYGQDTPIAFPVADLYDSGMMQMYVNAVRDQYQQGLKDYENFIAKYGDFTSPFAKDVDRWNNEIMGPTMNLIDSLYAQGIDPMRNAEARAMIMRSTRTVPYKAAADMKRNAAAGEAYLKARGALAAKGLYNKDYEDAWLAEQGYTPFEEWDSSKGAWNITSPVEYKSLFDATSSWFEKMQKHDLTPEQVRNAGYTYDPGYRYSGIPEEDLQEVTNRSIPGFMDSFEGRYYRNQVANRLKALGIEPTDDAVNAELAKDIVTVNHRVVVDPIAEADEYAKIDYSHRQRMAEAAQEHQWRLEEAREKANNSRTSNGSGGGSGTDVEIPPLGTADFAEAEQNTQYQLNAQNYANNYMSENNRLYKEQVDLYNKLTDKDKSNAVVYGKAWRTYNDPKASNVERERAKTNLRNLGAKKDPRFVAWKNKFEERMGRSSSPEQAWTNYSTTQGRANYETTSDTVLRKNSRDIFNENNRLNSLTPDQKKELNLTLNYSQDGDNLVGKMDDTRDVQDITLSQMTGDRRYKYNSVNRTVQRAIKGKTFIITPENRIQREYGAGQINSRQYNVVNDIATFTDPEVVKQLDKISESELAKYGIRKRTIESEDGLKLTPYSEKKGQIVAYDIPISTRTGHGMGRSDQNTQSDKRIGGTTSASKYRTTRQAREITSQITG